MTEAKRKPGRPRILPEGGKRLTVTLDAASHAKAEALGAGNVNAGIRAAIEAAPMPLQVGPEAQAQSLNEPV